MPKNNDTPLLQISISSKEGNKTKYIFNVADNEEETFDNLTRAVYFFLREKIHVSPTARALATGMIAYLREHVSKEELLKIYDEPDGEPDRGGLFLSVRPNPTHS